MQISPMIETTNQVETIKPLKIQRRIVEEQIEGLDIDWSDGQKSFLSCKALRDNCPSAVSKMQRGDTSHDTPLTPKKSSLKVIKHSLEEAYQMTKIWPVGNYAVGIGWADGHDSGIYSFGYLFELSRA